MVFRGYNHTFTADGKSLAAILGDVVKMWDLRTLQEIAVIKHKEVVTTSLAFSTDINMFAVGFESEDSQKSCIRVWQVPSFEEIEAAEALLQSNDIQ